MKRPEPPKLKGSGSNINHPIDDLLQLKFYFGRCLTRFFDFEKCSLFKSIHTGKEIGRE
jgi:hypothetical protein